MHRERVVIWHYTTGLAFDDIVKDGFLRPATDGVPEWEKPIVWFSKNQFWERTVNKLWRNRDGSVLTLTMEGTLEHGGGLVRIGVDLETAPYDWNALKEMSGMNSKIASALYKSGIDKGARPGEWRGTFEIVPREKWIAVEAFNDGTWVTMPFDCDDPSYLQPK